MDVRLATPFDAPAITDLSRRVQEALTAAGSLQQIGPIPRDVVAAHITAGTAHLLVAGDRPVGSVFVERVAAPVTPGLPQTLAAWGLTEEASDRWFLQKLMIMPEQQGQGLGRVLLDRVREHVGGRGGGAVVLDCWAGNGKLRAFYTDAGFQLHGVFPADGFDVAVFSCNVEARHAGARATV